SSPKGGSSALVRFRPSLTPDDPQWWQEHGISPEVRDAQGCIRTKRDNPADIELVRKTYNVPHSRHHIYAGRTDGLLYERHAPPGLGLDPIFPQWRPD